MRLMSQSQARIIVRTSARSCGAADQTDLARGAGRLDAFTPEMRHHQDNPVKALPVIGLDKVTGNLNLRAYYLRVCSSGEIAFVEDFADG